jgi:transcriptional regulator with XRE-family HTH domain
MANTTSPLLPATEELLKEFGERLRLARLRRRLQAKEVAERAGMTEVTLRRVERGLPGVTMGAYLAVMQVLQLQDDVAKWATNDSQGRHLQDAELQSTRRPKRTLLFKFPQESKVVNAPGNAKLVVKKVVPATKAPTQVTRAAKEEGKQLGGASASESVSATDLLKALTLPKPPGTNKT